MRFAHLLLLGLLLAPGLRGAPEPGAALGVTADLGIWKPLIEALASQGAIRASFTERRFFSIRKEPTVLKGVIRLSPDLGLSLQYTAPDPMILIVDSNGLLFRDAKGGDRKVPAGSRESGALASLLPVMRFDLAALAPHFDVVASGDPTDWSFAFTPKDDSAARSLGTIVVHGKATEVTRIEFRRSSAQRIEIEVGETSAGVVFTRAEVRQFFRGAGAR
jgi:hypothetical protein